MKSKNLQKPANLAELHERLGWVPLSRIVLDSPLGMATEKDVIRIAVSKSRPICELIEGVLVEKAYQMRKALMTADISFRIMKYLDNHDSGFVVGGNCAFRMKSKNVLFPDVNYLPWKKFPNRHIPKEEISSRIPTLAVQVLCEENTQWETERFIREMFDSGTKRIWVVNRMQELACEYENPTQYKVITQGGCLSGGDILPGFSLPLSDLLVRSSLNRKGRSK